MVFAARLAPVDRRRTGVGTPFFAWRWEPSTQARDQSSSPAGIGNTGTAIRTASIGNPASVASTRHSELVPT
ncbi:hypothetical protein GCM10028832_08380 [Streptomyces sparsus]